MSKGQKFPREFALIEANKFLERFAFCFTKTMICGSIRRKCPLVHDIDIVVVPDTTPEFAKFFLQGRKKLSRKDCLVPLELYIASDYDWGSQILMWTGSMQFNIKCRAKAKSFGWKLNQYGLFDSGGKVIESQSEDVIMCKLFGGAVVPEGRECDVSSKKAVNLK